MKVQVLGSKKLVWGCFWFHFSSRWYRLNSWSHRIWIRSFEIDLTLVRCNFEVSATMVDKLWKINGEEWRRLPDDSRLHNGQIYEGGFTVTRTASTDHLKLRIQLKRTYYASFLRRIWSRCLTLVARKIPVTSSWHDRQRTAWEWRNDEEIDRWR